MKLTSTYRFFCVIVAVGIMASMCLTEPLAAKQRSIKNLKKEQQAAHKSIKDDTRKLDENNRRTQENLQRLGQLEGELQEKNRQITDLRTSLDSINSHIRSTDDSIGVLTRNLEALKADYAKALRKMQGSYRNTNILAYLFSSGSFREATARYRYIKEFSEWRKRKLGEIEKARDVVDSKRQHLGSLHHDRASTLTQLSGNENQLRSMRDETDRIVTQLKKEGSVLQAAIAKNEKRLKSLDKELDRMIIEEQKRQARIKDEQKRQAEQKAKTSNKKQGQKQPSTKKAQSPSPQPRQQSGFADDRALTGSFESNKGRLLFPVRGNYTVVRGFGRQRHPELPNVMTDNTGIDIAASPGSKARCIYDGTVSGVFSQDGFSKVVMVRHGSYISIYANLQAINVKTGDKVKANQELGSIGTDQQYGNRHVLHFELRKERTKLNPMQWVK